jgi:hypothetical protein
MSRGDANSPGNGYIACLDQLAGVVPCYALPKLDRRLKRSPWLVSSPVGNIRFKSTKKLDILHSVLMICWFDCSGASEWTGLENLPT